MDLTSLSSTLPHNNPSHSQAQLPDDSPSAILMSAFKQAALSVTTLYKNANTELERSRKLGYQDCLEDLLQLLESSQIQQNTEVRKIQEWVLSKQRSKFGGPRRRSDPAEDSEDEKARMPTDPPASPMHSDPQLQQAPPPQHSSRPARPPSSSPALARPAVLPVTTPPSPPQQHLCFHKESSTPFEFRSSYRLPQHPPPPPTVQDADIVDVDPDVPSPVAQHQTGFLSAQSHSRTTTGAWKRRFPYADFLELAATAEKERDWVHKKGRLG